MIKLVLKKQFINIPAGNRVVISDITNELGEGNEV